MQIILNELNVRGPIVFVNMQPLICMILQFLIKIYPIELSSPRYCD